MNDMKNIEEKDPCRESIRENNWLIAFNEKHRLSIYIKYDDIA